MKYLVISDIHGDEAFVNYMYHLVEVEAPTNIILLGDLTSYYYDNYKIQYFVDEYKDKIILIKGNNDRSGIFDIDFKDFYRVLINNKVFLFTHGHLYSYTDFNDIDVYVCGHTHKCMLEQINDLIVFNPGSIASPRGYTPNSYGVIDDDYINLKDIDCNVIKKMKYNCINK